MSSCLCKYGEGAGFPFQIESLEDGVDDAVHALDIYEADHGPGATAHLHKAAGYISSGAPGPQTGFALNRLPTATASGWLCRPTQQRGRLAEWRSPQSKWPISACCHFQLPRLPTKEGLLPATPQLLFSALKLFLSQNFVNVFHAQAPKNSSEIWID